MYVYQLSRDVHAHLLRSVRLAVGGGVLVSVLFCLCDDCFETVYGGCQFA